MKRFHGIRLLLCVALSALAASFAAAQQQPDLNFTAGETAIITMKSGEKFEGKVLSQAPDSVEIEYKLTPKIKDKKILFKNEIASVKRQTASEVEFSERGLANILPTPDLMGASEYESVIQDRLRTFVAKYPGTPESAQAEKMIATLGEEKSKVVSGQLKVEGRWLDAATVKRDEYNINAYRLLLAMRARIAESSDTHYLEAMRAFEKLRAGYSASPYFLQAVPEAQAVLKNFETQLADHIKEAPFLAQKRAAGLKQATGTEAQAARLAIDAEERAHRETVDRQFKEKLKWKDIYKYDVKGLQEIQTTITKEQADLAKLDLAAVQAEGEVLLTVIRYLADRNLTEAGLAFEKAAKIQNPVNRDLILQLRKELDALRIAAKNEQKAAAAPATAAPAVAPNGGASASNPVAEAMKKIQEEKEKKAADAAKGGPAPKSPAGSPGAPAKPGADPAVPKKPAAPPPPVAAVEPPSSLMDTINDFLPIIGGALLAIIVVAWLLGKRKKEKEE